MKTEVAIQVRAFPVVIQDQRTGEKREDAIVLDKAQLQAAQLVGQSSKELIHRLYSRHGYNVLDIGKPIKKTILIDLEKLYQGHGGQVM